MTFEETFLLEAPMERVWSCCADVGRMAPLVPGVEEIEQTAPAQFRGAIRVKVGPVSVRFQGEVTVVEQVAPHFIRIRLKGRDVASLLQGELISRLTATPEGQVRFAYRVEVSLRGRLAQLGQAVVRDTASRISEEFVSRFRKELEGSCDRHSIP